MHSSGQRGNVLFLILIAVVLFAALSYAVSNSSRSGGDPGKEASDINASQLLEQLTSIRSAVNRMLLVGCKDKTLISYEGAPTTGLGDIYGNTVKYPSDTKCLVFHPSGGGLSYSNISDNVLDSAFSSNAVFKRVIFVRNFNIMGSVAFSQDIIVPFVKDDVCKKINSKLFGKTAIPQTTSTAFDQTFRGGFSSGAFYSCPTNPVSGTSDCGATEGCFKAAAFSANGVTTANVNIVYMHVMANQP